MDTTFKKFNYLKEKIREEVLSEDSKKITPRPLSKGVSRSSLSPVQYSDELRYLNINWGNWSEQCSFTSHRKFIGKAIVFLKNKFQSFIFNSILKNYFEHERNFNSNLVRFCNDTSKYIDARDKKIFWDLIEKIDSERVTTDIRNDTLYLELLDEIKDLKLQILKSDKDIMKRISILESKLNLNQD